MNDVNIKVSVIIPVYNAEQYLKECINSVTQQTLEDIEIICVDDGSTDNSLEMLKKYEQNDSRLKIYSKTNAGYGHTVNYGLERSSGKYVMIVKSDDFLDKKGMEVLYMCAEANKADYVRANYYEFREGKDKVNTSLALYPYN